jgi:choice-of-anchor C domain-containing protein
MRLRLLASTAVVLAALPSAASAQIVQNGSFETSIFEPCGVSFVDATTTGITNWTVESGNVDLICSAWQDAEGVRSLDLNGRAPGRIYQEVPTAIGGVYNLTFALAGNPGTANNKTLDVIWNGNAPVSFTFVQAGHTSGAMGWQFITLLGLVATSTTTRITFQSTTTATSNSGPALDAVSLALVSPNVVPEPATVLLVGGGLAALAAAARRRRV